LKGNLIGGMIAIMVGAILIFTIIVPIVNNGVLGTEYVNEAWINSTTTTDTTTLLNVTCSPLGAVAYVTLYNSSGVADGTVALANGGTYGGITWTNSTTQGAEASLTSANGTVTYRCLDSSYIENNTARTIANFIVPLVLVLLIIGLTAFIL